MAVLVPSENPINHRKAKLGHPKRLIRRPRIAPWILRSDTIANTQFPMTQAI